MSRWTGNAHDGATVEIRVDENGKEEINERKRYLLDVCRLVVLEEIDERGVEMRRNVHGHFDIIIFTNSAIIKPSPSHEVCNPKIIILRVSVISKSLS